MAGLSIISRLAIVVGLVALLAPCAMAQSTARSGRGPIKMKYTTVKGKFTPKVATFQSGVRIEGRSRVTPVSGRNGVAVKPVTTPKTVFVPQKSIKPINLTTKFSSGKSTFAQSRASFKKMSNVKPVKSKPIRVR